MSARHGATTRGPSPRTTSHRSEARCTSRAMNGSERMSCPAGCVTPREPCRHPVLSFMRLAQSWSHVKPTSAIFGSGPRDRDSVRCFLSRWMRGGRITRSHVNRGYAHSGPRTGGLSISDTPYSMANLQASTLHGKCPGTPEARYAQSAPRTKRIAAYSASSKVANGISVRPWYTISGSLIFDSSQYRISTKYDADARGNLSGLACLSACAMDIFRTPIRLASNSSDFVVSVNHSGASQRYESTLTTGSNGGRILGKKEARRKRRAIHHVGETRRRQFRLAGHCRNARFIYG